jgi:uncharacterized repeat protein (TIGR01451 family)
MTTTNGTAGAGTNYLAQTNTVTFLPGETNVVVKVTLLNDPTVQGDLTVDLVLLNPVGTLLLPPTGATLTIEDASAGPGQLAFATTNYSALEGQSAVVSVIRTNGRTGVVSVRFLTQPDTAVPAVDYVATNGVLTFADGETNKTFVVSTLDDGVVTSDKSLWLILTNVTGGASLGSPAAVPMVVAENDSGFVLGSPVYVASENAGTLVVTVRRLGSSNDTMAVTFGTTTNGITNNVAINGVDYTNTPSTNVFLPGETFKNFTLQVFPRPGLQGDRSFNVALSYPTNLTHTNLTASLGQPEKATVFILDSDTGFSFTNATFSVLKDGTNLLVTVVRTNPNTGSATVFYATQDGTAKAGQNYQPVVGTLVFNNGDVYQGFTVPILANNVVEGDKTFSVQLSNPQPSTNAFLVAPSNTVVTIVDNNAGLHFSSANYLASQDSVGATVTVVRDNYTNSTVSVAYRTSDGTATAGVHYTPVSGTLIFTNGVTTANVTVPIIDNPNIQGNHTVLLSLSTPTGQAALVPPSAATLNIVGRSEIASGGSALTVTTTFANTNRLAFTNSSGTAGVYPSTLAVSNLYPAVDQVVVTFAGLTSTNGQHLAALLAAPNAGPAGSNVVLMANAGARIAAPATLTFDDAATNSLQSVATVVSGTYQPTALAPVPRFPGAAPAPPYGTNLAALGNSNPNGTWSLYLTNDSQASRGTLANGWSLAIRCLETNQNRYLLPGETVTMYFALRNTAGLATTKLVSTLLASNGIAAPSGPQDYGALVADAPSVSRPFTFTANGTNGQSISAVFKLQDEGRDLGTVTFNYVLGIMAQSYTNNSPIAIPAAPYATNATPYPATNGVFGLQGVITKATVTLSNLTHTSPQDLNVLVCSPAGQSVLLFANAGGATNIANVVLTLDDTASNRLSQASTMVSGTNRPSDYRPGYSLPFPAPSRPYGSALSAFNGSNPNGLWSLYLYDSTPFDGGSVGAWWLTLSSSSPVVPTVDLALGLHAAPEPVVLSNNITYSLVVTNYGPGIASGVYLTNDLPAASAYISAAPTQGTVATNGLGQVIWSIGSLPPNVHATLTLVAQAVATGSLTDTARVTSYQGDPNLLNNFTNVATTVEAATADLAATLVGAPNPAFVNSPLTYSIGLTNAGPANATGVTVTNTLPPGLNLVGVWLSQGTYNTNSPGPIIARLGSLSVSNQATLIITVKPAMAGLFTNTVGVYSDLPDPLKGNNAAAVKTQVGYPPVTVGQSGHNLVIAWPAAATGYNLKATASLTPPVVWGAVTNTPTVVNGQNVITLPPALGQQFYRLQWAP